MNVFRRFAPEHREKMLEYYGKVLGLRSLSPITARRRQPDDPLRRGIGAGQAGERSHGERQYRPGR